MSEKQWIHLSGGKSFSRLLYPNPVCLLGTLVSTGDKASKNVMVLSWLTATNNDGRFVFSISKRRFTSRLLEQQKTFTLSVPKKGMEDMVLNVGAVSGRSVDKFGTADEDLTSEGLSALSNRKKRKILVENGVPGLESEPIGADDELFAIQSTVAQMICEITEQLHQDHEHIVYQAQILSARVDPDYWDAEKLLFRPRTITTAPFLTFFGSQTFGFVYASAFDQA